MIQIVDIIEIQPPQRSDTMETLKRAIIKIFPTATAEDKELKDTYKIWDRERRAAAQFGPNHVAEIDAIFSHHGY